MKNSRGPLELPGGPKTMALQKKSLKFYNNTNHQLDFTAGMETPMA